MRSKILSYLSVFLILIPGVASSAIFPTSPTVSVGGATITDLTNVIVLYGRTSGSTYTTLRTGVASAGYQVTAGKTLTIYAVDCVSDNSSSWGVNIGYGTADAGLSGASPAGVKYPGSNSSFVLYAASAFGARISFAPMFKVPAANYPFIEGSGVNEGSCIVYGYEQ